MRRLRCEKGNTNKGAWTKQEDARLIAYIRAHGEGGWHSLPRAAGLLRSGKSCRLRWINYLRPDVKRGNFSEEEDDLIIKLHSLLGNKWSLIAGRLPGRTDNEIKNYWNTHMKKRLLSKGFDPETHRPLGQPYNRCNNASVCRPAPDLEIPRFQDLRTPDIADFFHYDRLQSSNIEPTASNARERPDLNLDLCMSLPFHSGPIANRTSSEDRNNLFDFNGHKFKAHNNLHGGEESDRDGAAPYCNVVL